MVEQEKKEGLKYGGVGEWVDGWMDELVDR